MRPDVLIIARSGRQLANAATRAGYVPAVIDFFGDLDTAAVSAFNIALTPRSDLTFVPDELLDRVHGVFATCGVMPVVCGSGFESRFDTLAALAAIAPLSGCSPGAVAACNDPERLNGGLSALGIETPAHRYSLGASDGDYLRKRRGAAGGDDVHTASGRSLAGQREYFQTRRTGAALSIAFVAEPAGVQMLGACEPLQRFDDTTTDFRYTGALSAPKTFARHARELTLLAAAASERFRLRGLCGIDLLRTPHGKFLVLEINTRPTATFDLLVDPGAAFDAHVRAGDGCSARLSPYGDVRASGLCIADRSFTVPSGLDFPVWCADRPRAGTQIGQGMPICSAYTARAGGTHATRRTLLQRLAQVRGLVAAPGGATTVGGHIAADGGERIN